VERDTATVQCADPWPTPTEKAHRFEIQIDGEHGERTMIRLVGEKTFQPVPLPEAQMLTYVLGSIRGALLAQWRRARSRVRL